ncbi:hypothetical protein CR513_17408, partial [Mucuna pruriens]
MNGMDVSSWLLIEDSADSEGDSGIFSLYPCNKVANTGHNEDDAESCTCDTAGICGIFEDGEGHEDEKGRGDEDEGGGSDWSSSTMWMSDAALEMECSSPLVVEDEVETRIVKVNVNDVEDKIFWEICMAVGIAFDSPRDNKENFLATPEPKV